jgi:hypothetical protein
MGSAPLIVILIACASLNRSMHLIVRGVEAIPRRREGRDPSPRHDLAEQLRLSIGVSRLPAAEVDAELEAQGRVVKFWSSSRGNEWRPVAKDLGPEPGWLRQ